MIVLASIFRDSEPYIDRYFNQIAGLREYENVHLALAEGDSSDDTYSRLQNNLERHDTLIKVDHGGPRYGSVDHPKRWADIAKVVRGVIDGLDLDGADGFVWVESDLIWAPAAILRLVQNAPAAPLVLHANSVRFYDTWGYRQGKVGFSVDAPYCSDQTAPIDSCGSCFALSPRQYPALLGWDGVWPFAFEGLKLDTGAVVHHP